MRIIFMGSPDFAVPSLKALAASRHEVVAVYCQPPRPAGRGKAPRPTSVQRLAEDLGLEVRFPRTLRDPAEQRRFHDLGADLAVVVAYGLALPPRILEAPRLGCVNVHASLLPRWRGAAPIQRALLAGDKESGVTIMQMDTGLDTGPMLLKRKLSISGKTGAQVTGELAVLGAKALMDWLAEPEACPPVSQPADGVTYASKIDKAETRIDWSRSAEEIERQIRAFSPKPGAWFEASGERIKLLEAEPTEVSGAPGEVLDDSLMVACGSGAIRPLSVQRAGRGVMSPSELLRGFAVPKGARLP